jgi:hypothetical protein
MQSPAAGESGLGPALHMFTVASADPSCAVITTKSAGALAGGEGEGTGLLGEVQHWDPALRLVGAIAEGWAEESVSQFVHGGCEDPLSGMATLP